MDTRTLLDFNRSLSREGVLLCFNGPFSNSLIEEFGRALRRYLQDNDAAGNAVSDVFSVYIELAQNIQRYVTHAFGERPAGFEDPNQHAIVMITREGDRFGVHGGNRVKSEDVAPLREKLERVRAADKAALKAMYKEQLRAPKAEGATGAGLGFIAMARAASAPLAFSFEAAETDASFFSLHVVV